MKRIFAVLLSALVLFTTPLCFAGCNGKDDNKLTVWHDKEEAVIDVLRAELDKAELGFEVEFIRKEGLTDSLKLVGNDYKSAPDMFVFAHDKVGLFAEIGILEPITELLDDGVLDGLLETTLDAGRYKSDIYQLPLYFETLLFMYNKALMNESDVPKTTDDLLEYMKANTNKADKKFAFVEQHSTAYYSAPWIQGFGGTVLTADGKPNLTDEAIVNALTYHKRFLPYMPGQSEYSTINTLFTEGMAASIIGGPWLVPTVREAGIDLGFADMPIVNASGKALSPYLGVQGVHVLKVAVRDADRKAKIQRVLSVLASEKVSTDIALASGCAPARVECYEDERIVNDVMVQKMRATALKATPMPNLPEMDVMFLMLGKLCEDVNLKNIDPATACASRQEKAQELIDKMK